MEQKVTFRVVEKDEIEICRELCNELMALQKSKAVLLPEIFDSMNFDTRMKASYDKAVRKQVIVAEADGKAVGYVFSTIDDAQPAERETLPPWAPQKEGELLEGFYPNWVDLPQKIGCLSNLYLKEGYRGNGNGAKLLHLAMEWLESFTDSELTFVYISNGNDNAMKFYLNHGFTYSHAVFGGFIQAAYRYKK